VVKLSKNALEVLPDLKSTCFAQIRILPNSVGLVNEKARIAATKTHGCRRSYGEIFVQIANGILLGQEDQSIARHRAAATLAADLNDDGEIDFENRQDFSEIIVRLFGWGLVSVLGPNLRLTELGQKQYGLLMK
jgi:hypothetical protein